MLDLNSDVNSDAASTNPGGTTSAYGQAQGVIEQLKDAKDALNNFVIGPNAKTIFDNINKSIISMESSAKTLQRSMGGVVTGTQEFRERLITAYHSSLDIGASFKDITDAVEGLASSMGRIVNPSSQLLANITSMSKSTGIATKEIASMAVEFTRFGGTQQEALDTMHGLANEARKMGINTAAYMKEVNTNMKKVGGFGFKNGIDGLKTMAKQATMLRTTMDKIGAKGFADNLLDPEKAIEAAAGMQMLGGAVGKLADPFQLMHMAQSDMAGLQDELIKSTKAAFNFNTATGGFEASTEDLYRLREQARLTGQNFDDLLDAGREAAKMDYIQSKFSLDGLSEEQQGIVSSLAQIDKGGKVTVDIPGFDEIDKNTGEVKDLATLMKDQNFKDALDAYRVDQAKTEKDIAIEQMTISENQAKDINTIKEAVLKGMDDTERASLLSSIEKSNKNIGDMATAVSTASAPATGQGVIKINDAIAAGTENLKPTPAEEKLFADSIKVLTDAITGGGIPQNDAFIPSGGKRMVSSEFGKLLPNINDDILMAPNIGSFLNKTSKMNDLLMEKNGGQSSTSIGGKLDININVSGAVNGDNGNVAKLFEDPRVQKQIMDTVLYKLDSYKKQQGVIA